MAKSSTHFCDFCGKEVWGEDIHKYKGKEFCLRECVEEYAQQEFIEEGF